MNKKKALAVLNAKIVEGRFDSERAASRKETEMQIRVLADTDEGFENTVFELGCSVLAKHFFKGRKSRP